MKPYILAALGLLLAAPISRATEPAKPSLSANAAVVSRYVTQRGFDVTGPSYQAGVDASLPVCSGTLNASFWISQNPDENIAEIDPFLYYKWKERTSIEFGYGRIISPSFDVNSSEFYLAIENENALNSTLGISLKMYEDLQQGGSGALLGVKRKMPRLLWAKSAPEVGGYLAWNDRYYTDETGLSNISFEATVPVFGSDEDYPLLSLTARGTVPLRDDFESAVSAGVKTTVKIK